MIEKLIKNYINKLTINDVKIFATENNISLDNKELKLIYKIIKKDWKVLLYGEPNNIFNDLKNSLNEETYLKLEKLYLFYKNKYQDYL